MPVLKREGVDLYYEKEGKGCPLVLIGGLFDDMAIWRSVRGELAGRYDLVLFDNRCTGRSITSPCVSGRQLLVQDCLALLDELEIEQAHFLGYSLGGTIALHLAAQAPERVRSLIVACGLPAINRGHVALYDDLAALYCSNSMPRSQWYRLYFQWLYSPAFLSDENGMLAASALAETYPYAQSREALRAQVRALAGFLSPPDLSRIEAPVLALTAAYDLMTPPAEILTALRSLPRLEDMMLADTAHMPQQEDPAAFIAAVVGFHDRLSAPHFNDHAGETSPSAGEAQ